MKNLKLMLITLSVLFALSARFAPLQTVRASGDPQGGTDSQRRSTNSSQSAAAAAFWAAIGRIMWF